jgi:nucleoside phosphorylase/CheY-like chemotaxis protein
VKSLQILIVEDDSEKLRRVFETALKVPNVDRSAIITARDVSAARRHLRETSFDLVILDINLPETEDALPARDAGVKLLQEVFARPKTYCRPQHIVGLTAYDDALELASSAFANDAWRVVRYEENSETWRDSLTRLIEHIVLARTSDREPTHGVDLCVICALYRPELHAVLQIPWNWQEVLDDFVTPRYEGRYGSRESSRSVIAASSARMGMPAAASLAGKMIERFHPRYIAMVGIAAGIKGKAEVGDILVSEFCWDWGSGKLHRDNGDPGFSPSIHQIGPDASILGKFAVLARDDASLAKIRNSWPEPPPTVLSIRIGPTASGAAVIADSGVVDAIKRTDRKVIGVEMEAYGIFSAAREASLPSPRAFSAKAVCDFADEKKDDRFQLYAAHVSAQCLKLFAERYV